MITNAPGLRASIEMVFEAGNGLIYACPGTAFGGDDSGNVPSDSATGRCEDGVAKATTKYVQAVLKCHIKAADQGVKGKPFNEELCESDPSTGKGAKEQYDAAIAKLTLTCPACSVANASALSSLVETTLECHNGDIYCAGTTPGACAASCPTTTTTISTSTTTTPTTTSTTTSTSSTSSTSTSTSTSTTTSTTLPTGFCFRVGSINDPCATNADCGAGESCLVCGGGSVAACVGASCSSDADCSSGSVCFPSICGTTATADDQVITGTNGDDTIDGGAGNDTILGLAGSDTLSGGTGNDVVSGGSGADDLSGGEGNDILIAGSSGSLMRGGTGSDIYYYNFGPSDFILDEGGTHDILILSNANPPGLTGSLDPPVVTQFALDGVHEYDLKVTFSYDTNSGHRTSEVVLPDQFNPMQPDRVIERIYFGTTPIYPWCRGIVRRRSMTPAPTAVK